jgi:thioredoxin reductase
MKEVFMKIAIIGGGPGGYVAAIRAAQLNAEVALVEKDKVGGTCLNKGCIPTKVLLHASKEFAAAKNFESYGIKIKGAELDWAGIQKRKAEIVDKQVKGIEGLLVNNKVVKIKGEGSFISKNQLKVKDGDGSETRVDFDYAIIATGSKPFIIPIPGVDLPGVITSDEALNLTEVPRSMVIIGGGVIGCEFADVFSALGCKVTIIEMLPPESCSLGYTLISTIPPVLSFTNSANFKAPFSQVEPLAEVTLMFNVTFSFGFSPPAVWSPGSSLPAGAGSFLLHAVKPKDIIRHINKIIDTILFIFSS